MAKILVIDDYKDTCDALQTFLTHEGHEVFTAESGLEGLAQCRTHKPDVIVLDIVMKGMTGIEVMNTLKAEGSDAEVILITGHATHAMFGNAVKGFEEGAFNLMLKPVLMDALRFNIERAIEKRGMRRQLKMQQTQMFQMEKLMAVGQLGAGVAHEMNQPLMAMSTFLESILIDPAVLSNGGLKEKLLKIKDQFARLGTIVKRFHDYAGSRSVTFVMRDVNQPIRDGYDILKQQLKNHNIVVSERLSEGFPKVLMDRYQIEDVVINFLINAMDAVDDRFHRESGGEIALVSQKLGACGAVLFGVIDNGVPVKEGAERKIFNPFFTTKQPGKGTGLGLSVSSGIIKNHHGFLAFDRLSGERKIFYGVLPLNKQHTLKAEDAALAKDIKTLLNSL